MAGAWARLSGWVIFWEVPASFLRLRLGTCKVVRVVVCVCVCLCRRRHLGSGILNSTAPELWASHGVWGTGAAGLQFPSLEGVQPGPQLLPPSPWSLPLPHSTRQTPTVEKMSVWGQPFIGGNSLFPPLPVLWSILLEAI